MASVDLSALRYRTAKPSLLDFGGELTPPLGGEVQRINRLGTRYAIEFELPPFAEASEGRINGALLRQAKIAGGGLFPWPQPGLRIGTPGAPFVNGAVASGLGIPIRGATPHYVIRFGQFLSVIHGGRRYIYESTAQTIVAADGTASVPVLTLLRSPLSDGDVVEIAKPMIEGLLASGDFAWNIMQEPFTGLSFSLRETA